MTGDYVITITFGEQAENHVGMQQIGNGLAKKGISMSELREFQQQYEGSTLIDLSYEGNEAGVLIISNFTSYVGIDLTELEEEQLGLLYDKKAHMYGRVVNKKARYNLCFGDISQEPDYENKKGRVVAFSDMSLLNKVRDYINSTMLNDRIRLYGESNYYYDLKKCGIGFHGDSERKMVFALRLGSSMPLYYRWYKNGECVSDKHKIDLNRGDLYIMSEKATGWDWKRKKILTLRHATGCAKFTDQ